jgi:hypothetical protein
MTGFAFDVVELRQGQLVFRCSTRRLERGPFSRLPSPYYYGGGRGLVVVVSLWGFTVAMGLLAFVSGGTTVASPIMYRSGT